MNMYTKLELTRFAFIRDELLVLSLDVVHFNDKINDVLITTKICYNYTLYSYYIKYMYVIRVCTLTHN